MDRLMLPEPGVLMAWLAAAVCAAVAAFAARAAHLCVRDGMPEAMGAAVFKSVTKTILFLGLPLLIGFLALLNADARGGDGGGIMSRQMGLFVLFLVGAVALFFLWAGAVLAAFVATLIARQASPRLAGLVVFVLLGFAPLIGAGLASLESAKSARLRAQQR